MAEKIVTLDELLDLLGVEHSEPFEGAREVTMPEHIAKMVQGMSKKDQTAVIKNFMRLAYDKNLPDAEKHGNGMWSIPVPLEQE